MPIKLPSFRPRRDAYPPDLWTKCPSCEEMLFNKQLDKVLRVCPSCGHHFRLSADARLGTAPRPRHVRRARRRPPVGRPARVRRPEAYPDRIAAAQLATGMRDAAVWGTGTIDGRPVAICVMDFGFMGGSMGAVVGEKVTRAAEHALAQRLPLDRRVGVRRGADAGGHARPDAAREDASPRSSGCAPPACRSSASCPTRRPAASSPRSRSSATSTSPSRTPSSASPARASRPGRSPRSCRRASSAPSSCSSTASSTGSSTGPSSAPRSRCCSATCGRRRASGVEDEPERRSGCRRSGRSRSCRTSPSGSCRASRSRRNGAAHVDLAAGGARPIATPAPPPPTPEPPGRCRRPCRRTPSAGPVPAPAATGRAGAVDRADGRRRTEAPRG